MNYILMGEDRSIKQSKPLMVDYDMNREEAEAMLLEMSVLHPLWHFWIEEDNND